MRIFCNSEQPSLTSNLLLFPSTKESSLRKLLTFSTVFDIETGTRQLRVVGMIGQVEMLCKTSLSSFLEETSWMKSHSNSSHSLEGIEPLFVDGSHGWWVVELDQVEGNKSFLNFDRWGMSNSLTMLEHFLILDTKRTLIISWRNSSGLEGTSWLNLEQKTEASTLKHRNISSRVSNKGTPSRFSKKSLPSEQYFIRAWTLWRLRSIVSLTLLGSWSTRGLWARRNSVTASGWTSFAFSPKPA